MTINTVIQHKDILYPNKVILFMRSFLHHALTILLEFKRKSGRFFFPRQSTQYFRKMKI